MSLLPHEFSDVIPVRYHGRLQESELPVLNNVIQRLLLLLQEDDLSVNLHKVVELVRHDAVLSNCLFRMAHSAAGSSHDQDIEHAIKIIGTSRLRECVLAIGVVSACKKMRSPFNLWTYWISAATRAKIAPSL